MKIFGQETFSFNILSVGSSDQFKYRQMKENSHICQRLNIPLLTQNQQFEYNKRVRFQLPDNPIEQKRMWEENQNPQREITIKEYASRNKDLKIKRGLKQSYTNNVKPIEIQTSKIHHTNRDRISSMPTKLIQLSSKNIENRQSETNRSQSYSFQQNINQNIIPRIQLPNNYKMIRNESIKGIFNYINYQKGKTDSQKIQKRLVVKQLRLKIVAILVMAVHKLSKKYKFVFLQRNQAIQHFKMLKTPHLNHLNQYGQRQIKQQYQNFIEILFSKIITLLNSEKYIKDFSEIINKKQELIVDFQKQNLCYFIKLLFQDLELITRKNTLPAFILHSLNLSLFYGKNTQTSQFVSNRTQFYSKTVHSLTSEQKVLIAMEYLIFTIMLPNLLQIVNKQVHTNTDLQMNFQFYFIAFPVFFTVFFTNHFKNLPKIQYSNVKPVQLIVNVLEEEGDAPMKIQLITSSKLDSNEELVTSGDIKLNFVYNLFNEKPKWKIQMSTLFSKIVKNIERLIDIENLE